MQEAESEIFNLFAPYERAVNVFSPREEDSRRRLLSSIHTASTQPPLTLAQPAGFQSRLALIFAGILAAWVLVLSLVTSPPRRPAITADTVLSRSVAMEDNPSFNVRPGVILQHVELRSRGQRFEWPVYRDRQGKRKAQFQPASERESALKERLAEAGVERENPLSATSFMSWRDRFRTHSDSIVFAPSGLIIITTSLPTDSRSLVREETLTLRGKDYHPLVRTVAFRDRETVELAELDYQVLDWNQAGRDWFASPAQAVQRPVLRTSIPVPNLPPPPTEAQLMLSELQVRRILSQQNADVNEQIELLRHSDGIVVQGLASSAERKQLLQAALATVPHVTVDISTPAERDVSESTALPARQASIKLIESVSRPSPLLLYWQSLHRSPDEFPRISWQVLDSGLRISQQSHALRELAQEFAAKAPLDGPAQEAYGAVWSDHVQKLHAALSDQARVIKALQALAPPSSQPGTEPSIRTIETAPATTVDDLDRLAAISLGLCRELTAGEDSGQQDKSRDAPPILADLTREVSVIASALDHLTAQNH